MKFDRRPSSVDGEVGYIDQPLNARVHSVSLPLALMFFFLPYRFMSCPSFFVLDPYSFYRFF